jgi:hypothetical protein
VSLRSSRPAEPCTVPLAGEQCGTDPDAHDTMTARADVWPARWTALQRAAHPRPER